MKKYWLSIITCLCTVLSLTAQNLTQTENYTYSRTYLEPVTTSSGTAKQIQEVQYLDGLGRAKQNIAVKATPSGKDLVIPVEYDAFGRQVKDMLPLPQQNTNSGGIFPSPDITGAITVYGNASNYYREKKIENSPLNRLEEQAAPGEPWKMGSGKTIKYTYGTNNASEVKKIMVNTSWTTVSGVAVSNPVPSVSDENTAYASGGFYKAGTLYKNTITDEDGNKVTRYTNGKGQIILARKNDGSQNADTYYVYNEYGQQVFVILPLGVKAMETAGNVISPAVLDDFCYQYHYDNQDRLVGKKFPGKGWEYMVYDRQDRLVATQDAELKKKGQWLYIKYDQLGRTAITGIGTGGLRTTEQKIVDGLGSNNVNRLDTALFERQGMPVYYGNPDNTYPNSTKWVTLLSINYYDSIPGYSFNPSFPTGKSVLTAVSVEGRSTKGLPVMNLVKNIENDSWTKNYTWYDTKGREIGSYSINHLGGYTQVETELDFTGVPLRSVTSHKRKEGEAVTVVKQRFEYDNQNRLSKQWHQVNSQQEQLLSENTYNELSQLTGKKVGGNLQNIDYKYNIRGWVTKMNDPSNLSGKLFGYELKYNNPVNTSLSAGKFNGNITEVDWAAAGNTGLKRYSYQYDPLNRLKSGIYSEPGASVPVNNFYNETIAYDLNGKIQNLKRNRNASGIGAELIDNLNYTYSGSRTNTITDVSGNYFGYPDVSGAPISYDDNGNMTNLIDKGILEIGYNYLSLPGQIRFNKEYRSRDNPDVKYNVNTKYLYSADGIKLKKVYTFGSGRTNMESVTTTDYLDGFQYVNDVLKFVPTSEGYFSFENNQYIYNYTDHLGNIRLSYYKDSFGNAAVDRETNYYPFGLEFGAHSTTSNSTPGYQYKFLGQELQQETGWVDLNARFYMPDVGIFGQHDPLSASTLDPYGYAYNNPVMFADPTGLQGELASGEPDEPKPIGTVTNPIDVGEVVVNAPIRAIANNLGSILPNNCTLCYSGIGTSSGISLSGNYAPPLPANFKPVLHNGSAQMMDGLLWDVAAIYLANNVKPENKYAAMAVGALAIIISRGHAADEVLKAEASIAKAEAIAAKAETNTLIHYTSEEGYKAIMESGELLPSIGVKNARHGAGQYFTDLASNELTKGQVSRRLFGVPWNTKSITHFIEIDVRGLNVVKNAPNNFLIPNTNSLPLTGIIVNHGTSTFKP
ncbi:DUF6443 domain-containing protein [Chryseobacterium phocaeense]|uniref:DUF6443 domain-containing protein n=1 Tax=Chryseobacterium phocaeense TaxID=1816690 RepID=UPI0009BB0584|nr:DUF6443 domain-containing protein [Chryseobacterium phocaeense]